MIAALYVAKGGAYFDLEHVDPWDLRRDARLYTGPHPVVAHPPCKRWGKFATAGGNAVGDDGGCFACALSVVRLYGGVLEHPAYSKAWQWYDLPSPDMDAQWSEADYFGGRSIHVEQGHFGHKARKATWLYAVAPTLPDLPRGRSEAIAHLAQPGRCSKAKPRPTCPCRRCEALYGDAWRGQHNRGVPRLTAKEKAATPGPFRDLLLRIASSCLA